MASSAPTDAVSTATVSPNYEIMIPPEVRKGLGLAPGEAVRVFRYGERIEIIPVRSISKLRGFLRGMDTTVQRDEDRT